MLSVGMLNFMLANGHVAKAQFVKLVRNWHKASDGKRLSEETRTEYSRAMLNWMLENWMP